MNRIEQGVTPPRQLNRKEVVQWYVFNTTWYTKKYESHKITPAYGCMKNMIIHW